MIKAGSMWYSLPGDDFMIINGLQKLTLLDFPGKTACTVFLGGCNYACPFCHNAPLVLPERERDEIGEEEFFSFLKKRQGLLEGVCITGGEPTLRRDLADFIAKIKEGRKQISVPRILIQNNTRDLFLEQTKEIKNKE